MDVAQVGARLVFDVTSPAEVMLKIAVPSGGSLTASCAGEPIEVLDGQRFFAPVGRVTVDYRASVRPSPADGTVGDEERIQALLPSRYCPSDRLGGFALRMFGAAGDPTARVRAVTEWVHGHLAYVAGSSGPSTDAIDTLLSAAGVCRDYAHLVTTLCRALNVPARVVAVYAPGLSPMDFHLVTETALDGVWRVWDATRLAPRQSLIRIATGRDATDTALATTVSGELTMPAMEIMAVAPGDLPVDDHTSLVTLA